MSNYVHLGDLGETSVFGIDLEDLASRLASRVTSRVTTEVVRAVDTGVDRVAGAVSTGMTRFLDSPAGTALFDKVGAKVDSVAVESLKKRQAELAMLGVAGLAFFMGGAGLASRMGSRGTGVAFAVGTAALALVASGALAPPEPKTPPLPSRSRR